MTNWKNNSKHGYAGKKKPNLLYVRWVNIMSRCYYHKNPAYFRYGGRGIKVCERWHNPENFVKDLSPVPDGMTLDRINNDAGYSPDNVRWATRNQQSYNRRKRSGSCSRYKGVCFKRDNSKWCSRITFNKKVINLGYFKTETEAALVYNVKALALFGEFACLNKIKIKPKL